MPQKLLVLPARVVPMGPHRNRRVALWQGFLTRARFARLPASKPSGSEKGGWRAILARSARRFVSLATEQLRSVGAPIGTTRAGQGASGTGR